MDLAASHGQAGQAGQGPALPLSAGDEVRLHLYVDGGSQVVSANEGLGDKHSPSSGIEAHRHFVVVLMISC